MASLPKCLPDFLGRIMVERLVQTSPELLRSAVKALRVDLERDDRVCGPRGDAVRRVSPPHSNHVETAAWFECGVGRRPPAAIEVPRGKHHPPVPDSPS